VAGVVVDVLEPAPRDIFDAPGRNIEELLMFDPRPAPFRRQKIGGQIICARRGEYYINDGTNGVRVTTRTNAAFKVGDNVDVVGFLELNGLIPELSEAAMRRTGHAGLPSPLKLDSQHLLQAGNAGMRVQVDATLLNCLRDGNEQVCELQAGYLMFKSRTSIGLLKLDPPPLGSRLEIIGTYAPVGRGAGDGTVSGFEILMNSPMDARIVEEPPWWNLKRLLAALGSLGLLLIGVLAWNRQLHGQVQERTRKLEQEILNRQHAEMQRVAESERSRIARDLHDELGTGLTEVSLLASAGLGRIHEEGKTLDRFHAIAEKARTLVSGLDVIVWAIDPNRNSLRSFADYLADYANELFSSQVVSCQLKVRIECGDVVFNETVRHSLFLAAKEALNNIIKHSSATEAELRIAQQGSDLHIIIADNGQGFDWKKIRNGNGLGNLQERLKMISGECCIESQPGAGTTVKFRVPIECLKPNEESL
jgi:signal transduction histidine kinase